MLFNKNKQKKKESVFGIILVILAALSIRSCVIEPYHIPSSSMVPTLLVGDYLFISKYPYGYSKHSFLFSLPLIPRGRIFKNNPQQGDVVIFKNLTTHQDYIKRVIGMPGDIIQVKQGKLYINNKEVPRVNPRKEIFTFENGTKIPITRYSEILPNGRMHDILEISDNMPYDNTPSIVIPEDHFFVMGDNRDNSQDSRYFGPISSETLEGRAEIIFYSNNDKSSWFFQFWKWPSVLRLERFFSEIK